MKEEYEKRKGGKELLNLVVIGELLFYDIFVLFSIIASKTLLIPEYDHQIHYMDADQPLNVIRVHCIFASTKIINFLTCG